MTQAPEAQPSFDRPFIEEWMLTDCPDPYELPIRTAEQWVQGDEIWHLERKAMYEHAEEQLKGQGYDERHSKAAILIARALNNKGIAAALGISQLSARTATKSLYESFNLSHDPNLARLSIAHSVIRLGIEHLIAHSLERLPRSADEQEPQSQPKILAKRRLAHRAASFNLSGREIEVSLLAVQDLNGDEIGQRLGIVPRSVESHLYRIYDKVRCGSNRLGLMHHLYGTAPSPCRIGKPFY